MGWKCGICDDIGMEVYEGEIDLSECISFSLSESRVGFRVAAGLALGWPQNERSSLETLSWSRSNEKDLAGAVAEGVEARAVLAVRVSGRSMCEWCESVVESVVMEGGTLVT